MNRSVEDIAALIAKKAELIIMQELPKPDCPRKMAQWSWKIDEAKKRAAQRLYPQSMGITVDVKV